MYVFTRLVTGVTLMVLTLGQVSAQTLEISPTGQPDSFPLTMRSAQVSGFQGLELGMTVEQVREVIGATWPAAQIEESYDPVQRINMLVFTLDVLEPVTSVPELVVSSPAPATVTCLFGYQSERLATINLDWYVEGNATPAQRQALLDAGSAYTALMLGDLWPMMQSSRGHVLADGVLLLFAGRDREGRGVEVQIHGVAMEVTQPGGDVQQRPAPEGPARLHIGLSLMPDKPDVFRLPDNSF